MASYIFPALMTLLCAFNECWSGYRLEDQPPAIYQGSCGPLEVVVQEGGRLTCKLARELRPSQIEVKEVQVQAHPVPPKKPTIRLLSMHKVKKGESLMGIAKKAGAPITMDEVFRLAKRHNRLILIRDNVRFERIYIFVIYEGEEIALTENDGKKVWALQNR